VPPQKQAKQRFRLTLEEEAQGPAYCFHRDGSSAELPSSSAASQAETSRDRATPTRYRERTPPARHLDVLRQRASAEDVAALGHDQMDDYLGRLDHRRIVHVAPFVVLLRICRTRSRESSNPAASTPGRTSPPARLIASSRRAIADCASATFCL